MNMTHASHIIISQAKPVLVHVLLASYRVANSSAPSTYNMYVSVRASFAPRSDAQVRGS
jgi:hypothetical protein